MPLAAVLNPAARGGRSERRWNRINRRLRALGVRVDTLRSEAPGHATLLAREAIQAGYTTVLAVGGDGTVHEVVNGFEMSAMKSGRVRLGVIPAGTGMDFARNIGLPRDLDGIASTIAEGREKTIDLGVSSGGRSAYFVNFAETGLGAAVVAREARFGPAWPGRLSFLLAAVGAAVQEENTEATITVDGMPVYDGPLVSAVISNGRYFGGGMKIAPRASMQDGLFDVMILGDFSRAQLVGQIWKIYPGTHMHHSKVLWLRGRNVLVEPRGQSRLDLDGELDGSGPFAFSLSPAALHVLA